MNLKSIAKTIVDKIAPDYANRRYLAWGTPREAELRLLPALVSSGATAIDIGANRGLYVHHLLAQGAKVIAFEPLPPMQQWLTRHYGNRIDLRPIALSDHTDIAEIRYPRGNYSWATIAESNQLELGNVAIETLRVPMRQLDDCDIPNVEFIKVDVEGYEDAVLRGATETLRRSMPRLLIEIEERHNKGSVQGIRAFLTALGYVGYYAQNDSLWPISAFDETRDQSLSEIHLSGKSELYVNNFLFVPEAQVSMFEKNCNDLLARHR